MRIAHGFGAEAGFRVVMRQQFGLGLDGVGKACLQHLRNLVEILRGRLWIARLLRLRQHFDVGKFDPERKRACKAVTTHWGAVILLEQALRHLRTLARRA